MFKPLAHLLVVVLALLSVASEARAQSLESDLSSLASCRGPECVWLIPPGPNGSPIRRSHDGGIDWAEVSDGISNVFFRFFGNLAPNPTGIQFVSLNEHPLTEFVVPFGESRLSFVGLGNSNTYALAPTRFYREYNGILGLRYGLLEPSAFQVSVTASPASTTLVNVAGYPGVDDGRDLPGTMVLGGAGGLDVTYATNLIALEGHFYLMPGVDLGSGARGVRQVQVIEATFSLNRWLGIPDDAPIDLSLQGLHVERGDAGERIYEYGSHERGAEYYRGAREVREVWQAMAFVTMRRH